MAADKSTPTEERVRDQPRPAPESLAQAEVAASLRRILETLARGPEPRVAAWAEHVLSDDGS